MKTFVLIFLLLGFLNESKGQNSFKKYNDSCYQEVKRFYSTCNSIKSDKFISEKYIKIDKKLIELVNEVYNNKVYGLKRLKQRIKKYKNARINQKENIIEFDANTEGNLYVSIKAVVGNGILEGKEIYIATKSHVICNNDSMYVNDLDLLYLNKFAPFIKFPTTFKSYESSLEITPTN